MFFFVTWKIILYSNFPVVPSLPTSPVCLIARMHRLPEHVFSFFMSELATEGSIDANMRLVIKGRYVPKQIESLLKKYIGTL
jgi:translation initiation factor 2 beta subunit (eIF-2beta)/eIF-5